MKLKEIGSLVKKRREFLNLRQEDLSELSGITIKTIHLIEQGNGNPSFKTLEKLSKVLGLEIELKVKQIE
jgi:transcriptional regulator with XRE-family HTH domain